MGSLRVGSAACAVALLLVILAPRVGVGEEPATDPPGGTTPTLHGELRLALGEALAMGIENNLDVEIERHAPLIAREDLGVAWGAYDPELASEFGMTDTETPTASALQTGGNTIDQRTWDAESALKGLIPLVGGSYEFGYTADKTETNFAIERLSPRYEAGLLATLQLPLLRDLFWAEPWTNVKRARIGVTTSDEEFRRSLMDVVQEIEDAYWGLVASSEQLRVAEKSLETARALLDQTRTQYEVGVVSKVEVTEAEAGVAEREVVRIRAENAYRTAQDVLIDRVLGPHLTAMSQLEIEPTDDPQTVTIRDVDVEEALGKALERRPELAAARQDIERQEIELGFARNQRLPRLDLVGSYGFQGLSGRENDVPSPFPPTPINVGSRFSSADDDFFSDDGARQWSARGIFSIPLGNVRGRHDVRRRELELRRSRTQLLRLEQTIVLEIRGAARDLRSALEGIEAAERRRVAAAAQLRAERVRLEHGESTPFEVLDREEDLVQAESQKIEAERVYHGSVTAVDRAQGTILSRRNIAVEEAGRLR